MSSLCGSLRISAPSALSAFSTQRTQRYAESRGDKAAESDSSGLPTVKDSRSESLAVFGRLDESTSDQIFNRVRISTGSETVVVEDVTAVSRIRRSMTILRFATQMSDVLHRHKNPTKKFGTKFPFAAKPPVPSFIKM